MELSFSSAPSGRVSRRQTRSRTGCFTCKRRHLRCDEQRPFCGNCLRIQAPCEYPALDLPLRERRQQTNKGLPGELAPWSSTSLIQASLDVKTASVACIWQQAQLGEELDPFDCLPIKMPFKSKELLHYFVGFDNLQGNLRIDENNDSVAYATDDPHALRDTLLIAGLHYLLNTHDQHRYESALLFHKGETIRNINDWLNDLEPRHTTTCARKITTLCIFEACQGNFSIATAHLNGLIALVTTKSPNQRQRKSALSQQEIMDREITDRYLIFQNL
ncbi:hypothetical protein BX600DRAFT_5 [Xylariales sp. PMI_506]|nr:hypothetical protein BX600DRAFT_5 [Xylariales sp. PMI_506]